MRGVKLVPVDLDGEPGLGPEEVDLPAMAADVDLRLG